MKTLLLLLLLPAIGWGQDYAVSKIPADLLKDATAVIRQDKLEFEVEDKGKAIEKVLFVVTVFNETAADQYATLRIPYDKLTKIKDIDGKVYDAAGEVIFKIKNSDIQDIGMGAYQNDINDNRIKVINFEKKNLPLPFTIEYTYTEETKNLMFYPAWESGVDDETAVVQSSLSVKVPPGVSFRYLEKGFGDDVQKTASANGKTVIWEAKNLPARKTETFTKDYQTPVVFTAPIEFEVQGIEGSFKTWEDFAKFYLKLNEGRDKLPAETIQKVKELTQNLTSIEEKAAAIYTYLQATTHYLNISLGIGGWQTVPAENVASKGYGDCKALTNYFNAMLTTAGVTAYGALVYAGSSGVDVQEDFPVSSFNHIISCIPTATDTLWIECTSQTNPFGYQGDFTGNRKVLLLKPNGGGLVNTIRYQPEDNRQSRNIQITVDENGNAVANVSTQYSGLQHEAIDRAVNHMTADEQRKWLLDRIAIGNFELNKFDFKIAKSKIPAASEDLTLYINKCATKSGKRLFISPNLMTTFFSPLAPAEDRKSKLYLNENTYSFMDTDTITYQLPKGFVVEYLPENISLKEDFGEYSASVETSEDKLIYYRKVRLQGGVYPPEAYNKFVEFLKNVKKADRMRVVYVEKKT